MTIVHYEMLNIMVAIRTWGTGWSGKTVLIHCDNEAGVTVLTTGRTKDLTLAAIARNIWLSTAEHDIYLKTVYIYEVKTTLLLIVCLDGSLVIFINIKL